MIPIRIPVLTVLLLVCLSSGQVRGEMSVSFVGQNVVHFQVWHTAAEDETSYTLSVTDPSGAETALLDGASDRVSVRVESSNVSGEWTGHYQQVIDDNTISGTIPISIGSSISGGPLFSETVTSGDDQAFTMGTVTVNSGITLTVTGNWSASGDRSVCANGGTVTVQNGYYDGFHFSAQNSGTMGISATAVLNGCYAGSSSAGTLSAADATQIDSTRFTFSSGGLFMPGNAVGFANNTFTYRQSFLSGSAVLKQNAGTIALEPGAESAALSGDDYHVVLSTWPVTLDLGASLLEVQCSADIASGVQDSEIIVGDAIFMSSFTAPVKLTGLTLSSLEIYGAEDCEVSDCEIGGTTLITKGTPNIHDNQLIGGLVVMGGTQATITGNALHGMLNYYGYEPTYGLPTVSDNDFLGYQAIRYDDFSMFTNSPPDGVIHIGSCYYGSTRGPMLDQGGGFLGYGKGHQGGWVTANAVGTTPSAKPFTLAQYSKKRHSTGNPQTYEPVFWVSGWACGQGSLNWDCASVQPALYKKVPILISFDVKTSGYKVPGQDFYLSINNGAPISPDPEQPILSRDLMDFRPALIRMGATTVNFRIPETEDDSLSFELLRKNKNGDMVTMSSGTLTLTDHPWQRPLKVAIIPIEVNYTFTSVKAPAAVPASRFLQYVLPSMLPIPDNMLKVDLKTQMSMDTDLGLLSNLPGMAALAAKLTFWYVTAPVGTQYDLVVAVMPPDTIRPLSAEINYVTGWGTAACGVNYGYGDNFWLSTSRVLFTDAQDPMAMMHELGHAAGLYRDTEQYDMPEYKKTEGMPLRTFSAAALDPSINVVVNGFSPYSIMNFAPTNMVWYNENYEWIDVMGLPATQVWFSQGTASSVFNFFTGILQTNTTTSVEAVSADADTETSAATTEKTAVTSTGRTSVWPTSSGSASVMLSGIATTYDDHTVLSTDHTTAMETSELPNVAPALKAADNWYQYAQVSFYDASSQLLSSSDFDLPYCYNQENWWAGTWELPDGCARIELTQHRAGADTVIGTWEPGGTLGAVIDTDSLPDGILGNEFHVVWTASASASGTNIHLRSQVCLSSDGGSTWEAVDETTGRTWLNIATESFPAGATLAVRVIVSDGFTSASDTVSGLVVADRSPTLQVLAPREGDEAVSGTEWSLTANGLDIEDGSLPATWLSSRDGALTPPVVLSDGTHVLTASIEDSYGNTSQTSITVRVVSEATSVDLSIDSLKITGYTRDLYACESLTESGLLLNQTNHVNCRVRNSGIEAEAQVSMRVTLPDSSIAELTPVDLTLEAFGEATMIFDYVPEQPGVYRFEAEITPQDLSDRTPADNFASLKSFTRQSALLVMDSNKRQEFVSITERGHALYEGHVIPVEINGWTTLYNGGYVPLTISQIAFTNMTSYYASEGGFKLNPSPTLPLTLAPGESVQLTLYYRATTFDPVQTGLRVVSDDPRRPDFTIPVHGWMYDPEDTSYLWQDSDGDGIPSYIEQLVGLDPDNADDDSDGLSDGAEDLNANGIVEAWETDAHLADSDGDGVSDGSERQAHTDSCDDSDYLHISTFRSGTNGIELEWDGRAAVPYTVYVSDDLQNWQPASSGTETDEQAERQPAVNGSLLFRAPAASTSRFYSIRVPDDTL